MDCSFSDWDQKVREKEKGKAKEILALFVHVSDHQKRKEKRNRMKDLSSPYSYSSFILASSG